jgi:hypothetical protein
VLESSLINKIVPAIPRENCCLGRDFQQFANLPSMSLFYSAQNSKSYLKDLGQKINSNKFPNPKLVRKIETMKLLKIKIKCVFFIKKRTSTSHKVHIHVSGTPPILSIYIMLWSRRVVSSLDLTNNSLSSRAYNQKYSI